MTATTAQIARVNFAQAQDALLVAALSNTPALLIGDPGVGKTALAAIIASIIAKPLIVLVGATLDPTDVGGALVVRPDGVERVPLAILRRACQEPCVVFLDELSASPLPVQAAMLRVINERYVGDEKLHPETWVMAATNPPEQAPGGFDLSAPLMGRLCVIEFRPDADEVLGYLATLGEPGSSLRHEAEDFAATAAVAPDLLQIDIPPEAVQGNVPWGAPRAWERVLRARAAAADMAAAGRPVAREALFALMAGSVGRKVAVAYQAILAMREGLPSVDAIVADPTGAAVPDDPKKQMAALGLVPRVADQNGWAAYVYTARLRPEFAQACAKILLGRTMPPLNAPHAKAGVEARIQLSASIKRFR